MQSSRNLLQSTVRENALAIHVLYLKFGVMDARESTCSLNTKRHKLWTVSTQEFLTSDQLNMDQNLS